MRIFLDTNILLDVLVPGRSSGFASHTALQVIKRCRDEIYLSAQSIIDIYYTANKCHVDREDIDSFTEWLLNCTNVRYIDSFCIREALKSGHPDFEDSAPLACAEEEECDVFLTSDDGILSRGIDSMLVMTPGQFVDRMR